MEYVMGSVRLKKGKKTVDGKNVTLGRLPVSSKGNSDWKGGESRIPRIGVDCQ
jgi:hypothetical protein